MTALLLQSTLMSVQMAPAQTKLSAAKLAPATTSAVAMSRFVHALKNQKPDVFLSLIPSGGVKYSYFLTNSKGRHRQNQTVPFATVVEEVTDTYGIANALFTDGGELRNLNWKARGTKLVPTNLKSPNAKITFARFAKVGGAWKLVELSSPEEISADAG